MEIGSELREESQRLVESLNAFTWDLWRDAARPTGNLCMSPLSVALGLATAWAGARGETAAEIARVLHLGDDPDPDRILRSAAVLRGYLDHPCADATEVRVAVGLFADRSVPLEETYLARMRRHLVAQLDRLSFREDPEASRVHINDWVETQTAGRIANLIPSGSIDSDTRLVLSNALYFLSRWHHPFLESSTFDQPFFPQSGDSAPVPTMHQTEEFRYCKPDDLAILEMFYERYRFSMILILPDARDGLPALEARITSSSLDSWMQDLRSREVQVEIPRFKLAGNGSLRLGPVLRNMGMPLALTRRSADFRAIADPSDPRERLFLADVIHRAYTNVDETGTEAAAATAMALDGMALDPPPPPVFRADHPFLFAIRHRASGVILFVGRVADPSTDSGG